MARHWATARGGPEIYVSDEMCRGKGCRRTDFGQRLLERLQLLALLAVHAEQVPREDVLPDHRHDNRHEDVAAPDTVREKGVDI